MLRAGSDVLSCGPRLSHTVRATMAGLTSMGRARWRSTCTRTPAAVGDAAQLVRAAAAQSRRLGAGQPGRTRRAALMAEVRQAGLQAWLARMGRGAARVRARATARCARAFALSRRAPAAERAGAAGTGGAGGVDGAGAQAPPTFAEVQQRDAVSTSPRARARAMPRALSAQQMAEPRARRSTWRAPTRCCVLARRAAAPQHAVSILSGRWHPNQPNPNPNLALTLT